MSRPALRGDYFVRSVYDDARRDRYIKTVAHLKGLAEGVFIGIGIATLLVLVWAYKHWILF